MAQVRGDRFHCHIAETAIAATAYDDTNRNGVVVLAMIPLSSSGVCVCVFKLSRLGCKHMRSRLPFSQQQTPRDRKATDYNQKDQPTNLQSLYFELVFLCKCYQRA